ncbi:MAG: DUF418 domain-containing protein [Pseudomonadota bacterium]
MTYLEQSSAAGRHIFPDLARAVALIGIAVVNVGTFAYPFMTGYSTEALEASADLSAYFLVISIAMMKSYTLFSFMFGVGFAYQIEAAERRGTKFTHLYWRRLLGLFALGALHGAFFFPGDILAIYAVLGAVLFFFRNASTTFLIRAAISLYLLQLLVVGLLAGLIALGAALEPEGMAEEIRQMNEDSAIAISTYLQGSFTDISRLRFAEWVEMLTYGNMMQGIGALSFFLFGFASVKLNTIARPSARVWRRCRHLYLPIGVLGSLWSAHMMLRADSFMDPNMMFSLFLLMLFSPLSTAGYLGLIAKWAERPVGQIKLFLARGGTSSLTAYLLQSVILSLVFCGYGLGFYGQLGAATCIAIGLSAGMFSIVFTSLWRSVFERGPMEVLLRRWTYLGKISTSKTSS